MPRPARCVLAWVATRPTARRKQATQKQHSWDTGIGIVCAPPALAPARRGWRVYQAGAGAGGAVSRTQSSDLVMDNSAAIIAYFPYSFCHRVSQPHLLTYCQTGWGGVALTYCQTGWGGSRTTVTWRMWASCRKVQRRRVGRVERVGAAFWALRTGGKGVWPHRHAARRRDA